MKNINLLQLKKQTLSVVLRFYRSHHKTHNPQLSERLHDLQVQVLYPLAFHKSLALSIRLLRRRLDIYPYARR